MGRCSRAASFLAITTGFKQLTLPSLRQYASSADLPFFWLHMQLQILYPVFRHGLCSNVAMRLSVTHTMF